jgi:hypothetical protein
MNSVELYEIQKYLKIHLRDLQGFSNKCHAISSYCKGDGCGLTSGSFIDALIKEYFKSTLSQYTEYNNGESDMKLCNTPISFKKINGKSTIALDWSKNPTVSRKEYFTTHIMILNLQTSKWWKNRPKNDYTHVWNKHVKSGIYLIDKEYCKNYVTLHSNNKTNTLIDSQQLYLMLENALYIEIPSPNHLQLKFNILNSFNT